MDDMQTIIVVVTIGALSWAIKRYSGYRRANYPPAVVNYLPEIRAAARRLKVPEPLLASIMMQESSGNPDAQHAAGEIGLMGLMQVAADDVQQNGLLPHWYVSTDPANQLLYGAGYLRVCYNKLGNWPDAVRGYNAGWPRARQSDAIALAYRDQVLNRAASYGWRS